MFERLARQLGQSLQADEALSAYLLVDPMLREPFPKDWLMAEPRETWPVPVRHPLLTVDQHPRLIKLHPHDTHLLEASVDLALSEQADPDVEGAQGFALGGWLLTKESPEKLSQHLARCMHGGFPIQAKPTLIRWADRRVMEWMWPVLTRDQQAGLLGPVHRWYSLDRCRALVRYEATPEATAQSPRFSNHQWAHAVQNEAVQDLIRGWQRFSGVLPSNYLQQSAHAARAAIAVGLKNRQDRVLLGAYILQVHPQLTTHPDVRRAIELAMSGVASLVQALGDIPDPDGWDGIRTELDNNLEIAQARLITKGEQLGQ